MSNLISHDDYRPDYSYFQSQNFVDLQHVIVIVIRLTNTPDACHIYKDQVFLREIWGNVVIVICCECSLGLGIILLDLRQFIISCLTGYLLAFQEQVSVTSNQSEDGEFWE